jgi:hypothetical protein
MNSQQHLSDEAVAAFADGALSGHAQQRARRHTSECPECAYAVAVQREAAWALRAAPAPALPTGLLDRLREVPSATRLQLPPTALGADGSTLLATFGTLAAPTGVAAVAPTHRAAGGAEQRAHRLRPIVGTAVAVAAAGVLAVGSAAHASGSSDSPSRLPANSGAGHVQPAVYAPAQTHR